MGISAWLLDFAILVIDKAGYLGISFILIIDNAGVPIPSEGVLGLAGVASNAGNYNFVALLLIGTIMQTAGASLAYWIGHSGGETLVRKYGKYLLISSHDYDKAHVWFAKRGAQAIFVSRITPVVRTFMGFVAGAAHMDYRSFFMQSLFGSAVWSAVWLSAGYILGDSWQKYYHYAHYLDYLVYAGLIILLGRFLWHRRDKFLKPARKK